MVSEKNLSESLAENMNHIIKSDNHKNIFAKYAKADKAIKVESKNKEVEEIYNDLVRLSGDLDGFGFEKSALNLLGAANDLSLEFYKKAVSSGDDEVGADTVVKPGDGDADPVKQAYKKVVSSGIEGRAAEATPDDTDPIEQALGAVEAENEQNEGSDAGLLAALGPEY